jgi:hypothetical protein
VPATTNSGSPPTTARVNRNTGWAARST